MSGHGDSHESHHDVENVSRVQSSAIVNEGDVAKERIQGTAVKVALLVMLLISLSWIKDCRVEHKEKEIQARIEHAQRAEEEAKQQASLGPALDPKGECVTPCSLFVGWDYKVRTDGHPLRIRHNGCKEWFEEPKDRDSAAPECARPGNAEFESQDPVNPHVRVQVYEKFWRTR